MYIDIIKKLIKTPKVKYWKKKIRTKKSDVDVRIAPGPGPLIFYMLTTIFANLYSKKWGGDAFL